MTKLRTAALSDIGNLRSHNEDRYLRNEALGLFGVADGIGFQFSGSSPSCIRAIWRPIRCRPVAGNSRIVARLSPSHFTEIGRAHV